MHETSAGTAVSGRSGRETGAGTRVLTGPTGSLTWEYKRGVLVSHFKMLGRAWQRWMRHESHALLTTYISERWHGCVAWPLEAARQSISLKRMGWPGIPPWRRFFGVPCCRGRAEWRSPKCSGDLHAKLLSSYDDPCFNPDLGCYPTKPRHLAWSAGYFATC